MGRGGSRRGPEVPVENPVVFDEADGVFHAPAVRIEYPIEELLLRWDTQSVRQQARAHRGRAE